MTEYNNDYEIDYDKPGFCALCHCEIADFEGFNADQTPKIVRLKGKAAKITVQLDDGSDMDVMVCKACKSVFKSDDAQRLMESVQRGWQWEVQHLLTQPLPGKRKKPLWDEKKAKDYLTKYRKLRIVNRKYAPWSDEEKVKAKKPRKANQLLWGKEVRWQS